MEAVTRERPPALAPGASVGEAAGLLRETGVSVVVVREGDDVVGVVTGSDLVAVLAETDGRPSVGAVMSTPVETVAPTATLPEAAARMREAGVRHLVVDDGGTYDGVLSAAALAPHCSRHNLDIEWGAEPLRVDDGGGGSVAAGD